jgi:hypothetical protein
MTIVASKDDSDYAPNWKWTDEEELVGAHVEFRRANTDNGAKVVWEIASDEHGLVTSGSSRRTSSPRCKRSSAAGRRSMESQPLARALGVLCELETALEVLDYQEVNEVAEEVLYATCRLRGATRADAPPARPRAASQAGGMMTGEYKPFDDRELAHRVVTRGIGHKAIAGTKGQLLELTGAELEYLRWLGEKVLREQEHGRAA